MDNRLQKLKHFNIIMGLFHLIQGLIMLVLATSVIQSITEFQPEIVQRYQTYNVTTQSL